MPLIPQAWSERIHYLALCLIAFGLPLSRSIMSIGVGVLVFEALFGPKLQLRIKRAFKDPAVLSLIGIYLIHILGLIHTQAMDRAFDDLRIKLPLLLFPLAMGGREDRIRPDGILIAFFLGFLLSSIPSYLEWMGWIQLPWSTTKDPTLFISAVRLSLMGTSILFFAMLLFRDRKWKGWRMALLLLIAWTLFYLGNLATGISIVVFLALTLYFLERWRRRTKSFLPPILMGSLLILPLLYFAWEMNDFYQVKESPLNERKDPNEMTAQGNAYTIHTKDGPLENGYYVRLYICEPELKKAWNARSEIPFKGKDRQGNELRSTLIRYMTSKGLKKDAEGMEAMSKADIERVENGVANIAHYRMNPVRQKLRSVIFEIDRYWKGFDPSGNSVTQRFEFWRAGLWIVAQHPWTGVGTGDLTPAFDRAYRAIDTELDEDYWMRAHQQFFTFWIAFGPLGLLLFLFGLLYPPYLKKVYRDPFYMVLFITLFLSFLTEDTLESQAGVTLFAFWNCFFLFRSKLKGGPDERIERPS